MATFYDASRFLAARLKPIAALFAALQITLLIAASRAGQLAPAQDPPLDIRFGRFTAAEAADIMNSYSPAGRSAVAAAEVRALRSPLLRLALRQPLHPSCHSANAAARALLCSARRRQPTRAPSKITNE